MNYVANISKSGIEYIINGSFEILKNDLRNNMDDWRFSSASDFLGIAEL